MEDRTTILEGCTDLEKASYLGAIASIATADRQASEEEIEYLDALCDSAGLNDSQKQKVLQSARDTSEQDLTQHLDVLKNSELKYSLITDLITFAQADQNYSEDEKQHVQQIANYLQVDQQQYSLLKQYSDQALNSGASAEQVASPNFLANTGLQQKMQSSGINTNGLLKGLLGFVGPMILANMLRRRGRRGGMMGGGLGGALGGMLGGGLGGMMGGGMGRGMTRGGGLGSLIGMLSGGRGMSSAGGMLGRMLGGRF